MNIKYVTIAEVHQILKEPSGREAWKMIYGDEKTEKKERPFSSACFIIIEPDNHEGFQLAPAMPCINCEKKGMYYGVAIRNGNHDGNLKREKLTLFVCPVCRSMTTKPFNQYPFIREGSDENSTKTQEKTVG